ncbi:Flap endonuclease 1 [Dictyocoela muelleri]|nr:Flap endonuclease 1 [Dictyocoela muelleri]
MPIRGLESLKSIRQILRRTPSVVLKDSTICIDGHWFMRKYLYPVSMEQYFINGLDLSNLHKFVAFCKDNNVDVCWVWNGLIKKVKNLSEIKKGRDLKEVENEFKNEIKRESKKEGERKDNFQRKGSISDEEDSYKNTDDDLYSLGISEYEKGNIIMANKIWKREFDPEDHICEISEILRNNGMTVVRAPYAAIAQCVYFQKKGLCNYVFGPTDLFLFEIEKIITDFHFLTDNSKQIELWSKTEILKALRLPNNLFLDLALLLGCEYCPTIPPFANNFSIQNVLEIFNSTRDGWKGYKRYMECFYEISGNYQQVNQGNHQVNQSNHQVNQSNHQVNQRNIQSNTKNNQQFNNFNNKNNLNKQNHYQPSASNLPPVDKRNSDSKVNLLIVTDYMEKFLTAKGFVKHHPVMTTEGITLLSGENPSGLEKVFGKKLPSSFYENLFLLKISPDVLLPLVYGEIEFNFKMDDRILDYQIDYYNSLRGVNFNPENFIKGIDFKFQDKEKISDSKGGIDDNSKGEIINSKAEIINNQSKYNFKNNDSKDSRLKNNSNSEFNDIKVTDVNHKTSSLDKNPFVEIRNVDFYAEISRNLKITNVRQILCMMKPLSTIKPFDVNMIPFLRDLKIWYKLVMHKFQIDQLLGKCKISLNLDVPMIGSAMNLKKINGCVKLEIGQREMSFLKMFKEIGNSEIEKVISQVKNFSL